MKSIGIRIIDKRGNVAIPKSFLKMNDIKKGDYFELWLENGSLIIQKLPVSRCVVCGGNKDLLPVKISEKAICKTCFELMGISREV